MWRRRLVDHELVGADGDLLARFGGALELVAGLGDFLLRIALLDGRNHAAHRVELLEIIERAVLHVERQPLDEVRAAQRIDGLGHAGFVSDDLLRAQRDAHGFFRGQRQASS